MENGAARVLQKKWNHYKLWDEIQLITELVAWVGAQKNK